MFSSVTYFTCQVLAAQQMPSCSITNDDYIRGHCWQLAVISLTQQKNYHTSSSFMRSAFLSNVTSNFTIPNLYKESSNKFIDYKAYFWSSAGILVCLYPSGSAFFFAECNISSLRFSRWPHFCSNDRVSVSIQFLSRIISIQALVLIWPW